MNSDQVSRDDSCSLVISRGTEGDGYTRGYNNTTQHIAYHKNITGLAFCHRYRRTVHECCREEAVYKCSAYIIYINNVLCRRRICPRTTCGSICGTWRSRTSPSTSWTSSPPTWRSSRRSSPPPSSTPRSAISSSTAPAKEPSDCVT